MRVLKDQRVSSAGFTYWFLLIHIRLKHLVLNEPHQTVTVSYDLTCEVLQSYMVRSKRSFSV